MRKPAGAGGNVMETTTVLLGSGQLVLTLAVVYTMYLLRRGARRSSLVALVELLNDLREKNGRVLAEFFALMASEDFKKGDAELRSGLIDSTNRLRAIQAAITEALLQALRECHREWSLAGRLHAAFRSQVSPGGDKQLERFLAQEGLRQAGAKNAAPQVPVESLQH